MRLPLTIKPWRCLNLPPASQIALESHLPWDWAKVAPMSSTISTHVYEVRPRKDHRGVDLNSDVLPFGRLWYHGPGAVSNAIGYAKHRSRSYHAVIRVYDETGNVMETHEHAGEFKEP
jgi:hypothetical protein